MDRRKDQIILVKKWYACLIAGCVLRIEGELRQEPLARRIAARDLLELNEVRAPRGGILVNALEMGFVPEARALSPAGQPAPPAYRSVTVSTKDRQLSAARGGADTSASARIGSPDHHVVEYALRRSRSDARRQVH